MSAVFRRLSDPSKCKFALNRVKVLRHEVGSRKRSPSEAKLRQLRIFLFQQINGKFENGRVFYLRYVAAPLGDPDRLGSPEMGK